MPDIDPRQALAALMLGTGETELVLDHEVILAVAGVDVYVEFHPESARWHLRFSGMPDPKQLEAKGMRLPDLSVGYILGAQAVPLDPPRQTRRGDRVDPATYGGAFGFDGERLQ